MSKTYRHSRPNVFEIDLDAIVANVREIRRFVGPGVRIFVAMKANAYGFGLVEVADILEESGIDAMCVADLMEAARLREHGIETPILLYAGSAIDEEFVRDAQNLGLWLTIPDFEAAATYARLARSELTCFVKVDVGLERLGIPADEAGETLLRIGELPHLRLAGIYTHLHVPDEATQDGYVDWQLERFAAVVRGARAHGPSLPIAMAASTPIVPGKGPAGFDAVDVGRLIYGSLRVDRAQSGSLQLRNAFAGLRSRLIQCKSVSRSDYLEEAPFEVRPGMRIGIAPMGYADGLESLNCGVALVRGRRVAILPGPSLEHTRLDLSDVADGAVGDEVVFVGRQDNAEITPDEVLRHLDIRQPARMATAVRHSVTRVYLRRER